MVHIRDAEVTRRGSRTPSGVNPKFDEGLTPRFGNPMGVNPVFMRDYPPPMSRGSDWKLSGRTSSASIEDELRLLKQSGMRWTVGDLL
jgi:hypothetical protein